MLFFGLIAAAHLLDVRQLSAIDSACTVITQTIQIEGYLRAWPTAAAGIFHRTATIPIGIVNGREQYREQYRTPIKINNYLIFIYNLDFQKKKNKGASTEKG